MENRIGNNIKTFRLRKSMTQEQLAEYLNVSHQSVSKWESGQTTPDVAMFPRLAQLFGVSIDDLFGYENTAEKKEVQSILRKFDAACIDKNLPLAESICREGLRKYPQSCELKFRLANTLKTRHLVEEDRKVEWLNEAITLCEDVIHMSHDAKLIHLAKKHMAIAYAYKGDRVTALQVADDVAQDFDYLRVYLFSGTEKIAECKKAIDIYLSKTKGMLRLIAKVYRNQGNFEMAEKYSNASVNLLIDLND